MPARSWQDASDYARASCHTTPRGYVASPKENQLCVGPAGQAAKFYFRIMRFMPVKRVLVNGAGGFIGSHLVARLRDEGFWVRGADLKFPEFSETAADDLVIVDLREPENCRDVFDRRFDEVYQLAADMGGAGYIFTGRKMRKKSSGLSTFRAQSESGGATLITRAGSPISP